MVVASLRRRRVSFVTWRAAAMKADTNGVSKETRRALRPLTLQKRQRDQPAAGGDEHRRSGHGEAHFQIVSARSFEIRTSSSHNPSVGLRSARSASGASRYHAPLSTS